MNLIQAKDEMDKNAHYDIVAQERVVSLDIALAILDEIELK